MGDSTGKGRGAVRTGAEKQRIVKEEVAGEYKARVTSCGAGVVGRVAGHLVAWAGKADGS